MKAFLMYQDRDFDMQQPLPPQAQALIQDLELQTLFTVMAQGDQFVFDVVKQAVLSSVTDLNSILYRQHVLQDCLKQAAIVRAIYALAGEAIAEEKKQYLGFLSKYPDALLRRSMEVVQMFMGMLKKLKEMADDHAAQFASEGFTAFFAMLDQELSDAYFARVQYHLKELQFRDGVWISAELGQGNKGSNYVLRHQQDKQQGWIERIFADKPLSYTFHISDRDESGARALSELKDRGINLVANALAQSADHLLSFFTMLRTELAFYIGCLNLYEQLAQQGIFTSFPLPVSSGERRQSAQGLVDACLALTMKQPVVSNDLHADGKDLVIITGANQGGKSTFLRSIGLAQVMMQCGLFVTAEAFCANICTGLFTHYKRKEDVTMKSGKLAEELGRMSEIVDALRPDSLVLCNESFAATNEREGSEIARQIVNAFVEKRIKVFFVTHFYAFAQSFYDKGMKNALFLRAERQADGRRTFKLREGAPLQTSFGEDVYHRIFDTDKRGERP